MIRGIEPIYTYTFDEDCDVRVAGHKRAAEDPHATEGPPAKGGGTNKLSDFFARDSFIANRTSDLNNNVESDHVPRCKCNKLSSTNVVRKDGPNKGRVFFVCDVCKFFEWQDKMKDKVPQYNQAATGPQCKCKQPSVMRTATKDGPNKGRSFWTCLSREGCGYFLWVEN